MQLEQLAKSERVDVETLLKRLKIGARLYTTKNYSETLNALIEDYKALKTKNSKD